tara:strand:- start:426327 stop:426767 length:441 start_codon:yes stop_codon:yes gene_type:complete
MKTIILLLFLVTIGVCEGQNQASASGTIGFSCSFGGTQSIAVKKVSKMIRKADYSQILNLIDSGNAAEKYLAIISLEKLVEKSKIKLTALEKSKILTLYNSTQKVFLCSGCTFNAALPLNEILKKGDKYNVRRSTSKWFEATFTKN